MQSPMTSPPEVEAPPQPPSVLGALAVACASRTLDALEARGHLKKNERDHIESVHLQGLSDGKPNEIFETITRLSTVPPREIPDFIAGLGLAVAKTLRERVPLMPNLKRVPTPAAFFTNFSDLANVARTLLVPVLYSEDEEVIGVGSVNPIPALQLASMISRDLPIQTGFTPFVSVIRLDYDTWRTLIEKQFGL